MIVVKMLALLEDASPCLMSSETLFTTILMSPAAVNSCLRFISFLTLSKESKHSKREGWSLCVMYGCLFVFTWVYRPHAEEDQVFN